MSVFDIREEPIGETYDQLLHCGAQFCDTFLLVVREQTQLDKEGRRVLDALSGFLISLERAVRWPGTELMSGSAEIYKYSLSSQSLTELTRRARRLFEWVAPARPEDLCLIRQNKQAWLTTISHERDAYLSLAEGEREILTKAVPNLLLERNSNYQ